MFAYTVRRLLLMIPTLLGIMILNFAFIQSAPGGPVERAIGRIRGGFGTAGEAVGGGGGSEVRDTSQQDQLYKASKGISPDLLKKLEVKYGFDKPIHIRFLQMMGNYLRFDFGDSFAKGRNVISLIVDKMPVSISLGLWSTLIIYVVSIPLGIRKAIQNGSKFDFWTSTTIIIGNAIPGLLFAVVLVIFFAGGRYYQWFPLTGLSSKNFADLNWWQQLLDYTWHLVLPITTMVIGGFAGLTLLTKNSFLSEISKQYVLTAKAKGLTERRVLYGHVFRNAMLIVIAGFPAAFIGVLFTGSLITEVIFSLDGIGLLGFEAARNRDYPLMFGTLYLFSILGLLLRLVSDLTYTWIDPRIDFEARG
jgi:microcin C transport system permease protein